MAEELLHPLVRAEGFGYRYPERDRDALTGVSLALEEGSFTVLAGLSGSGKSTLLRALCGLIPHFYGGAARGELMVGGLDVSDHGPAELAAVCGTVFQDPESQVVMGGVRAEIALSVEHRGEAPTAIARAVEEVALTMGVAGLLHRRTETLSGGELQRVAIAAALVGRPRLLLLDEPTSQLDPVAGDELIWLLRRVNEEWGTTVVIAEHRLERCLAAADRVVVIEDAEVAHDSDPRAFLAWDTERGGPLSSPIARLFSAVGLGPAPTSVKEARDTLRAAGLAPAPAEEPAARGSHARRPLLGRLRGEPAPAVSCRDLWCEMEDGPAVLRGIHLDLHPGELVALMGRNGAGKSTLLRHLRGLMKPTRGRVDRTGEVALLLQNPGDYLIHDHVRDEAGEQALGPAGIPDRGEADPRDLSGGERQRLALEVVLGGAPCAAVCLDEPTRGMDRIRKEALAGRLVQLAAGGAAVVVATHDTEFAAQLAERVVLMGQGEVIADGPADQVLAGGWHYSTETARVLGGAGGALTPSDGARVLARELVT
ncbi:MAG: ATP-binding cassette domain-containing protein [Thermoleophilaceae bacterium]